MKHARRLGWVSLGVLILAASVLAEDADEEIERPKPMVLRMYNVKDLVVLRKDYPLSSSDLYLPGVDDLSDTYSAAAAGGGGFGDLFGGWTGVPTDQPTGWQELVDIIQRTVNNQGDPDVAAWSDEGGPAAIEYMNGVFIVTQSAEGHRAIDELLALLRKQHLGKETLTVQARWVLVDGAKVTGLTGSGKGEQPARVTVAALEKAGAQAVYQGSVRCYNCQTVHVASGRIATYVGRVEPVVSDDTIGVAPMIHAVFVGAALQIKPILMQSGKEVLVDLHSHVNKLREIRDRPLPDFGQVEGVGPMKVNVELPDLLLTTFRTTARIPLATPVLIGGMTTHSLAGGKVLYLVLTVTAEK